MPGWLVEQLPRALSNDPFTRRFVAIFEEISDGIRHQIDALEYYLDVDTAPGEFVRWLGAWLNATIGTSWPDERQRQVVRTIGQLFPIRGTRAGLEGTLGALTGGEVRITDGGGVWRAGEAPPAARRILVRFTTLGAFSVDQLYRLIQEELPVGVTFELRMDTETLEPPPPPPHDLDTLLPPDRLA